MRIAISADSFLPFISGVTTHTVEFTRWLLRSGHEVLLFTPKHKHFTKSSLPNDLKEAKIIFMRSIPTHYHHARLSIPNTPKVFYYLQKFKPDIVDLQAPSFQGIDVLTMAKALQIPIAATFHTLFTTKEYLETLLHIQHVTLLEKSAWSYHRWFYNSADSVLVSTEGMKTMLLENGIKKDKLKLIPILFDFDNVTILDSNKIVLKKKELHLKTNVAVYVGRISKEKAIDTLIEIWEEVIGHNKDASLLIIGDGPYRETLEKQINNKHLAEYVHVYGSMPHQELLSSGIMSIADVFVSASTTETFGLTGLEAMAHSIPVILANTQGLSEQIKPLHTGFLCKPHNIDDFTQTILYAFDHKDQIKRIGTNARIFSSQFGGKLGTKTLLQTYQQTIDLFEKKWGDFSRFLP